MKEGAVADVAVFSLTEGEFTFVDAHGNKRRGQRKLVPVATVKAGKPGGAWAPVPEGNGK